MKHFRLPRSRFITWLLLGCLIILTLPSLSLSKDAKISVFPPSLASPASPPSPAERQLQQGQPEVALAMWQEAERSYRRQGNLEGAIGSQINQARALQSAGFYRRAKTLLEEIQAELETQPNVQLKFVGLLNLGNVLRVVGDLGDAQTVLERAVVIAKQMSPEAAQVATFHLANALYSQQKVDTAIALYQRAMDKGSPVQLQAQLNLLDVWLDLDRQPDARSLIPIIQTQLENLPLNPLSIYGRIELAESWQRLKSDPSASRSAVQLLAEAVQQARTLGNVNTESYALGKLGHVYELAKQWKDAEELTTQAWQLAQSNRALDIAYQWQWQLGRLRAAQGDRDGAIARYTQAVTNLRSLRLDLIAVNLDVQFSFREQVEPVYRELVDLLLREDQEAKQETKGVTHQQRLIQAREVIEALQLAELTNFFRASCLDAQPEQIDKIDPKAAVIYPIILRDRLEVIVAVPGQPLTHHRVQKPQAELESFFQQARNSLRPTSFAVEYLSFAHQLYDWLIRPIDATLTQQQIQTLVFVLDGSLRGLPMAILHDGQQFLVQRYRLALAPGLQLLSSRPLNDRRSSALFAGLSESIQGFSPMPAVVLEANQVQQSFATDALLNHKFTRANLQRQINARPYPIVHLATHGRFSSLAEKTFLLTWDDRITVRELDSLIRTKETSVAQPIELLVLSACETATGDQRAALGMAGIALRSGARSTLATLWLINDDSTVTFMAEFYRQLTQTNLRKAEAVRQAQLKLLSTAQFQHPFYWASFVLIGNWL
jgi:CHAT domain-containing protein